MEKNIIDAEVINKKDVPPDVEKRRLTDQYGPLKFVPKDEEFRDSYSETRSIFDEYRKARLGTLPEDVTAETFISAVTLDFAGYEDHLRWGVSGATIEKNTNEGLVTISLAPGKRAWFIKMKRPGHIEEYSYRPFEGDNEESIDDYGNIKPLGGKVHDSEKTPVFERRFLDVI